MDQTAEMLIGAGRATEAITHVAQVLGVDPEHTRAKALMSRALGTPAAAPAESSQSSTDSTGSRRMVSVDLGFVGWFGVGDDGSDVAEGFDERLDLLLAHPSSAFGLA